MAELASIVAGRLARLADSAALAEMPARIEAGSPAQAVELDEWAARAGVAASELLALDGGLVATLAAAGIERSLGLYVDGPNGPVLAGAWSLPEREAEQVALRPCAGGWLFGLPGMIGLAGVSAAGVAIVANHLRPATLGPGLPGGVLLRSLLDAPDIGRARSRIEATPLADGRNWMLADGETFFGIEQLGDQRILTRVGPKTGHVHANHCFDPALRQREATPRDPLSFRRLELASTVYVQRRPATGAAVLEFFDEVEAAAFAEPGERAQTLLAIEITAGLAHWRAGAGQRIHTTRLSPELP